MRRRSDGRIEPGSVVLRIYVHCVPVRVDCCSRVLELHVLMAHQSPYANDRPFIVANDSSFQRKGRAGGREVNRGIMFRRSLCPYSLLGSPFLSSISERPPFYVIDLRVLPYEAIQLISRHKLGLLPRRQGACELTRSEEGAVELESAPEVEHRLLVLCLERVVIADDAAGLWPIPGDGRTAPGERDSWNLALAHYPYPDLMGLDRIRFKIRALKAR